MEKLVYFGTWEGQPLAWRILDTQRTNAGDEGMLLVTEDALGAGYWGGVAFDESGSQEWQGSFAQAWCADFLEKSLSVIERSCVVPVTKSDGPYTSPAHSAHFRAAESVLDGDRAFFLSAEEAEAYLSDYDLPACLDGNPVPWWLRSPAAEGTYALVDSTYTKVEAPRGKNGLEGERCVGLVGQLGEVCLYEPDSCWAARPALNVDTSRILYWSGAEMGKASDQGLCWHTPHDEKYGKLTLLDPDRRLATGEVTRSGNTLTVSYTTSGVKPADDEYVAAIVKSADGKIEFYGRVGHAEAAGSAEVFLRPEAQNVLWRGGKLYLYSEQYHGDNMTDYASALQEIGIPLEDSRGL